MTFAHSMCLHESVTILYDDELICEFFSHTATTTPSTTGIDSLFPYFYHDRKEESLSKRNKEEGNFLSVLLNALHDAKLFFVSLPPS